MATYLQFRIAIIKANKNVDVFHWYKTQYTANIVPYHTILEESILNVLCVCSVDLNILIGISILSFLYCFWYFPRYTSLLFASYEQRVVALPAQHHSK